VQPNIPQEEKWQAENQQRIAGILASLTRERLSKRDASLVLWPEAALPGFLIEHPEWRDTVRALTRGSGVPLLFGVLDVTFHPRGDYEYFNAALLADITGNVRSQPAYHKEYLVPIVERVPFVNPRWFAHLKYFGGYARGRNPTPFVLPFGHVGVLICYESIFPQLSRYYRRQGATILVNITNDAWFGRSIAPYQHAAHLSLRAIENRVGIVRAANTGISGYVDPLGRLHGATALFTRETRTYEAQSTNLRPLYVRVGDWVSVLSTLATLAALAYAFRLRRRP
jgi:apolipoprotein N-acyltransferase